VQGPGSRPAPGEPFLLRAGVQSCARGCKLEIEPQPGRATTRSVAEPLQHPAIILLHLRRTTFSPLPPRRRWPATARQMRCRGSGARARCRGCARCWASSSACVGSLCRPARGSWAQPSCARVPTLLFKTFSSTPQPPDLIAAQGLLASAVPFVHRGSQSLPHTPPYAGSTITTFNLLTAPPQRPRTSTMATSVRVAPPSHRPLRTCPPAPPRPAHRLPAPPPSPIADEDAAEHGHARGEWARGKGARWRDGRSAARGRTPSRTTSGSSSGSRSGSSSSSSSGGAGWRSLQRNVEGARSTEVALLPGPSFVAVQGSSVRSVGRQGLSVRAQAAATTTLPKRDVPLELEKGDMVRPPGPARA